MSGQSGEAILMPMNVQPISTLGDRVNQIRLETARIVNELYRSFTWSVIPYTAILCLHNSINTDNNGTFILWNVQCMV